MGISFLITIVMVIVVMMITIIMIISIRVKPADQLMQWMRIANTLRACKACLLHSIGGYNDDIDENK